MAVDWMLFGVMLFAMVLLAVRNTPGLAR